MTAKKTRPEYGPWMAMKTRCSNRKQPGWKYYGARGITVCEKWWKSFEDFVADVGPRPSRRHWLERSDNDGNYEPGNVRWATAREQCNNKRSNRRVTWNGATRTLAEWERITGVSGSLFNGRKRMGWSDERALLTPPDSRRGRGNTSVDAEKLNWAMALFVDGVPFERIRSKLKVPATTLRRKMRHAVQHMHG